jgi:uncharacterized protein (TIGR00251 family)
MSSPNLKPIQETAEGVLVRIKVQPRASRDEVLGVHGDAVRIRLRAPPIDGSANDTLIRLVAERLDVPRSTVHLRSGQTSRSKLIVISGVTSEAVAARLGL